MTRGFIGKYSKHVR